MKEYMLLIRNDIEHQASWPEAKHKEFLKKCERYIGELKKEDKLIIAQPLVKEGSVVSGISGDWKEVPLNTKGVVQVGYYHIRANDIEEAIEIAKRNPEFEFSQTARIEVRPIKVKEETTGFIYSKGNKQFERSDDPAITK
ncbi:MAG: YciI family protein [Saprospiraceae bacterium]